MSLGLPQYGWSDSCIDVYEKIECIGVGTYGQVYLASHRDTGEKVALKKIRSLNEVQGLPVTTIREIKVLKAIQHRNIVGLREVIVTNELDGDVDEDSSDVPSGGDKAGPVPMDFSCGCIYIVLEYVDHDLTGLLDRQYPFSDIEIKSIMKQLLEVMKSMHAIDIIHRDIKCSNLLITTQNVLKVADFGLARSMLGDQPFTNKVVTLWYRSPELLLGTTAYDGMVDMWSIGCVFVELYIGRPLFSGKNEIEQIKRIFDVCGTPTISQWPDHPSLPYSSKFIPDSPLPNRLSEFIQREVAARSPPRELPPGALDLMLSLLKLNPNKRITAAEALRSRYFHTEPYAPDDPESLPPISCVASHEFQTKKIRKENNAKQRTSMPSSGGGRFPSPPPPPLDLAKPAKRRKETM
ncbi:unnamed protein product [Aphanomyces euteiches]|uniref:Cyclin-dependent kinase 2 homolog n=1 Tax=Aphanomyces euteiches TaxID=100861 RepID=A0A6G0W7V5_9STRA|nr:hypothetical protein Ae201684_018324 [Aphanomyces euteiches]KAH9083041.1 hypothetical protein Ae201684P_013942 [Aphanomyces euteiches]KAH9137350.1 hypothetical protein AeRB84_017900 [Aphanomyces euteiches]